MLVTNIYNNYVHPVGVEPTTDELKVRGDTVSPEMRVTGASSVSLCSFLVVIVIYVRPVGFEPTV